MTHEERLELLQMQPGETISPTVLAQILGGMPYQYNLEAKAGKLTLPHMWRGRNLRIFKSPLIKILEGGNQTWTSTSDSATLPPESLRS